MPPNNRPFERRAEYLFTSLKLWLILKTMTLQEYESHRAMRKSSKLMKKMMWDCEKRDLALHEHPQFPEYNSHDIPCFNQGVCRSACFYYAGNKFKLKDPKKYSKLITPGSSVRSIGPICYDDCIFDESESKRINGSTITNMCGAYERNECFQFWNACRIITEQC